MKRLIILNIQLQEIQDKWIRNWYLQNIQWETIIETEKDLETVLNNLLHWIQEKGVNIDSTV